VNGESRHSAKHYHDSVKVWAYRQKLLIPCKSGYYAFIREVRRALMGIQHSSSTRPKQPRLTLRLLLNEEGSQDPALLGCRSRQGITSRGWGGLVVALLIAVGAFGGVARGSSGVARGQARSAAGAQTGAARGASSRGSTGAARGGPSSRGSTGNPHSNTSHGRGSGGMSPGGSSTGRHGRCGSACRSKKPSGRFGRVTGALPAPPTTGLGSPSPSGTTHTPLHFKTSAVPAGSPPAHGGPAGGGVVANPPAITSLGPAAVLSTSAGSGQAARTATVSAAQQARDKNVAVRTVAFHGSDPPSAQSKPDVIERFVDVIPKGIWIALAAALALAAMGAGAAVWSGRRMRRQAGRFAAVSEAALTDPLTGVLNRRGFIDAAERELARARRYGRSFVVAYVDVRGLKAVNDTEGHLAGDGLLRQVASLLTDSARADDVVGRIGGDELALLLPEQSGDGAMAVAARITSLLPERRAGLGLKTNWDLTIGTATYPDDGKTVERLLAAADRRLYEQRGIALL
jgi:diguanylate cyclase (GGDEF)-like protein